VSARRGTVAELVTVRSSPREYEAHKRTSFFLDLIAAASPAVDFQVRSAARARLQRHREELEREARAMNTTLSTGGELSPPAWLTELWSSQARSARVFSALCKRLPLPEHVSSVHIPKMTVGTSADVQTAQGAPATDVDPITADRMSTVQTITGDVDMSQQLYDLTPAAPGMDSIIFDDLTESYDSALEAQCLAGSGVNGQLVGLSSIPSVGVVTYTSGSPTLAGVWAAIAEAVALVGNKRLRPATDILMAPRRYAWLGGQVDDSHRPIIGPGNTARASDIAAADGLTTPVGPVIGKPVWETGAIPAGTSSDVVIACRPGDFTLFESDGKFSAVANPLSGDLQMRLQLRRYVAFVTAHVSGVAIVSGTGLAAPSGY
jgi:HK97 family phage major capsid protein